MKHVISSTLIALFFVGSAAQANCGGDLYDIVTSGHICKTSVIAIDKCINNGWICGLW